MKRTVFVLIPVLVTLLDACGTVTTVDRVGDAIPGKSTDCIVQFFDKSNKPARYDVVGKIETHIEKNIFFGSTPHADNEGYKELRTKACELGGDAVIVEDTMESHAAEMNHLHIWASVIRLKS
jgi:hypothetical protein